MKQLCLFIFFLFCGICDAQNLIPNGDFEQFSGCPSNISQLDSALYWLNPTTNILGISGTPDYFNACGGPVIDVPNNWLGFQQPHSGFAYAGIYLYQLPYVDVREYLEIQLPSLVPQECYFFEMYVNLGDSCQYTNDDIGVYFSDTLVSGVNNILPLPFVPQINNASGNFPDSSNWKLVSGSYIATGTENYMIIGSFVNDSIAAPVMVNNSTNYNLAYIYVDDVSLILTPCTGINENINERINIYPNPITDILNITNISNEFSEIILYDIASRKLLSQSFTNSTSINTEQLAKGIYLYEVRNKSGVIKKGKVVKD